MASFSSSSSSWSSDVYITNEEFNMFHSIDRELYALLVINLLRDPAESMQVIALWLWLERKGFRHVVKTMLSLPHFLVNELADEAVACLKLAAGGRSATAEIPLTQSLLEKEAGLLVHLLRSSQLTIAQEVSRIVNEVCVRAMGDILREVVVNAATTAASFHLASSSRAAVPADDRTMFVTFSKGYPVYEWEVREFFTRAYGDSCIESLHMQDVQGNEQPLFARIVFNKASTIDIILNGLTKAKFTINGKHVWMRKFVPKRPRSSPVLKQQQLPPPPVSPPPPRQEPLPNLPDSLFDY